MSLFDAPTAAGPSPAVVQQLEGYGYAKEKVRKWTVEHANTVLNTCRKRDAIALRRAQQTAREQDQDAPRGQPSLVERQEAAAFIEQQRGPNDLLTAVSMTAYCLTDDELGRLAGYFVRLFRGQDGQRPGPAEAVRGSRVDGGTDAGRAAAGAHRDEPGEGAGAAD